MINKSIGEFMGFGGVRLCYQSWLPETDEKASVIIMHGGNDFCDLRYYDDLAYRLAQNGYAVYSYDQRGTGRSEGLRFDCWDYTRADCSAFARFIKILKPSLKLFIYGISFGSLQTAEQAIISPERVDGIILSSFSTIELKLPTLINAILAVAAKFFPSMGFPTPTQETFIGAKEALNGNAMWKESLCGHKISAYNLRGLTRRQREINGLLGNICCPVLHLQGSLDTTTLPDESIKEKLGTKDYTYKTFETGHDILRDAPEGAIASTMIEWMDERYYIM